MPQSIPPGLKREHVLQALADLDAGIDHPFGPPTRYELVHEGKHYPPKVVVEELKKASKDLLFPSETDAPFKAFLWMDAGDALTPERVGGLTGKKKGRPLRRRAWTTYWRPSPARTARSSTGWPRPSSSSSPGSRSIKSATTPSGTCTSSARPRTGNWPG